MRRISLIIIHCSGVRPGQLSSARQIDTWHRNLGWDGIGYHYVIRRDGTIEKGRPETVKGAHCKGHNAHSIGVCYEGGLDSSGKAADTRTAAQRESLRSLVKELLERYPKAQVYGHCHFNKFKVCPCFDVNGERYEV